jgi:choline dehydrogenase
MTHLPVSTDILVVGGGTCGAAIAGRMAEQVNADVLLLEAGPDFGPHDSGNWPQSLLNPFQMPVNEFSWGYVSAAQHGTPGLHLPRARVMGGCSAHNGCAVAWGHRLDYDGWRDLGNLGWGADDVLPIFQEANRKLRVHTPDRDLLHLWYHACLDAGAGAGMPCVDDLSTLEIESAIGISPFNIVDDIRWNCAFAYLDHLRGRDNLQIFGDVLVDRVLVEGGRAVGVEAVVGGETVVVRADLVVLCGGVYGTPLMLLRSGIGPEAELTAFGIPVVHDLPGVGRNLQDHVTLPVLFAGTPDLIAAMDAYDNNGLPFREAGIVANGRSSYCNGGFDIHLYPWSNRASRSSLETLARPDGDWIFSIWAAPMTIESRGTIRLGGRDPEAQPVIDHCYLTDPEDRDLAILRDGVELARALAAQEPLRSLAGPETSPGPQSWEEFAVYARATCAHDYHPVGTCKMGPASDPMAVVDATGAMHDLAGLVIGDAAIMPVVPRANTNLPALVVAENVAAMQIAQLVR